MPLPMKSVFVEYVCPGIMLCHCSIVTVAISYQYIDNDSAQPPFKPTFTTPPTQSKGLQKNLQKTSNCNATSTTSARSVGGRRTGHAGQSVVDALVMLVSRWSTHWSCWSVGGRRTGHAGQSVVDALVMLVNRWSTHWSCWSVGGRRTGHAGQSVVDALVMLVTNINK